jgi:hypothetical protein
MSHGLHGAETCMAGPVGTCWCGEPGRGLVGPEGDVPEQHRCGQCSIEHCEHQAIARRCQFGICVREAELELTLSETLDPVRVCGLHVAPVLGWGVPEPIEPRIRYLAGESAAPDRAA